MDGRDDQAKDARLAVAASQGDDEAFGLLYERYAPRIGAYLTRLLDDEHLAQDLTHEVFVSALRRLRTDRPPIAFGPWLYRIARNASIDVHRRAQIVRQVPLDGAGEERQSLSRENTTEDIAEVRQWLEQLRDVLGGLSETHRTVLVLRELEGLSNGEIGERLGISRPAVEGLLFRARAKLRREYDDLVSGKRCELVCAALDRGRDGTRLAGRDLDLAARHVRACAQCRRHAWEVGLGALLAEANGPPARRLLLPVPLAVAAFTHRLAVRVHAAARSLADPPAAFAAPWGRAAAGVAALAVAGSAAIPPVRDAVVAAQPPARAAVRAAPSARPAPPAASPAAAPTTLLASAVPLRAGDRAAPPPAPDPTPRAGSGSDEPALVSPAAASTALPADPGDERPARAHQDSGEHHRGARSADDDPARAVDPSAAPVPSVAIAAVQHVAQNAFHRARHPLAPVSHEVSDLGGVLTQATETATQVVDRVAAAPAPSPPADPAPAVAPAIDPAAGGTGPAPDVVPAPAPPTVPAVPVVPVAPVPDPQPPQAPTPVTAPDPAAAAPIPPTAGTLAERRAAAGQR